MSAPASPPRESVPAPNGESPRTRGGRAADVRSTLQEEIEVGILPPGAPLDERALAQRFGVSRTPIREALQQLAALDLVRIAPRHGVSVARLSIQKLRSMLEYISETEALAAKLAARRLDARDAQKLQAALAACQHAVDQGDGAAYARANVQFHDAIYSASRNEYLAANIRTARRLMQRYRVKDFQTQAQIVKSLADHVKVAEAVQSGDEEAAACAMLLHVPAGTTGFSEFLASVPQSFFEPEASDAE